MLLPLLALLSVCTRIASATAHLQILFVTDFTTRVQPEADESYSVAQAQGQFAISIINRIPKDVQLSLTYFAFTGDGDEQISSTVVNRDNFSEVVQTAFFSYFTQGPEAENVPMLAIKLKNFHFADSNNIPSVIVLFSAGKWSKAQAPEGSLVAVGLNGTDLSSISPVYANIGDYNDPASITNLIDQFVVYETTTSAPTTTTTEYIPPYEWPKRMQILYVTDFTTSVQPQSDNGEYVVAQEQGDFVLKLTNDIPDSVDLSIYYYPFTGKKDSSLGIKSAKREYFKAVINSDYVMYKIEGGPQAENVPMLIDDLGKFNFPDDGGVPITVLFSGGNWTATSPLMGSIMAVGLNGTDMSTVSNSYTNIDNFEKVGFILRDIVDLADKPAPETDYCKCVPDSVWLDIIFLVDSTNGMGENGVLNVIALMQGALYQMSLGDAAFRSRVAVITYGDDAVIVRNFTEMTSHEDIDDLEIPYLGGGKTNILAALVESADIYIHQMSASRAARRVIVLIGSEYNKGASNDPALAANEFKNSGGTLIVVDYLQVNGIADPTLSELASPGYYFTNAAGPNGVGNFTPEILVNAFCDINCYCATQFTGFARDASKPGVPSGGCYEPINLPTTATPSQLRCSRHQAFLATVHDNDKQEFLTTQLFPPKTKVWIGVTHYGAGNRSVWTDGRTDPYTVWGPQEPSIPDSKDYCVYTQQYSAFKTGWFAVNCFTNSYNYVCQHQPCDSTFICSDS